MTPSDGGEANADRNRCLRWASVAISLGFCGVTISNAILELLNLKPSQLLTAGVLYLPLVIAAALLFIASPRLNAKQRSSGALLGWLTVAWLVIFLFERAGFTGHLKMDEYDANRLWFFIPGTLGAGYVGILASAVGEDLVPPLTNMLAFFGGLSSLLYLANFRPETMVVRLLDDRSLGFAIIGSLGATACLCLLALPGFANPFWRGKTTIWLTMSICLASIVFSGTRGAMLVFMACLFFLLLTLRRYLTAISIAFTFGLTIVILWIFLHDWVPEATIGRLANLEDGGLDIRRELASQIWPMIINHPFGRVHGYFLSPIGMDYCHNTLVQFVAEAGIIQTILPLLLLLARATLTIGRSWVQPHFALLLIPAANIFLQSFSSGAPYNAPFWFFLLFYATIVPVTFPWHPKPTSIRSQR